MTDRPRRIRIQRGVKGWTANGARYCTHGTKFGNPFYTGPEDDRATAVAHYRAWIGGAGPDTITLKGRCYHRPTPAAIAELRGRNLACYCPLDQPCHADVLRELANNERPHIDEHNHHRLQRNSHAEIHCGTT